MTQASLPPEIINEIERLSRSCEDVAKEAEGDQSEVGVARVAEVGNILAILRLVGAVGHLRSARENEEVVVRQRKRVDELLGDRQATGKSGLALQRKGEGSK